MAFKSAENILAFIPINEVCANAISSYLYYIPLTKKVYKTRMWWREWPLHNIDVIGNAIFSHLFTQL